jgi:uncharacterized damage-inducible protein DinB
MSPSALDRRQQFLDALSKEHDRTMRVLRAYPAGKSDFKPHPKSQTARELAWVLAMGHSLMVKALTTGFDWSKPSAPLPHAPATTAEIADALEQEYRQVVETLRGFEESRLDETVQFMTGPKTLGDWKKVDFLWFLLFDHVHHRGQLSVYLRMADGRVPAIYGPSGDEKWT